MLSIKGQNIVTNPNQVSKSTAKPVNKPPLPKKSILLK